MMVNKFIIPVVILGIMVLICGCIETQEKEELTEELTEELKEELKENQTAKNETGERPKTAPEFASVKEEATAKCIDECKSRKDTEDFSSGPCLSNEIATDWVCDVAHKPRQDVDNKPENQCSAFREGKAHHFVELDTDCSIIKVY